MARIKSYSCSKCGGILNVDIMEEYFDCPFCGSKFDVFDFHSNEIRDEAQALLRKDEYAKAHEKFEELLVKSPDDFELLRSNAFAVGNITHIDKLESPENLGRTGIDNLRNLLTYDKRYTECENAPYFAKILEMIDISREYGRLSKESREIMDAAQKEMDRIDKGEYQVVSNIVVIFCFYISVICLCFAIPSHYWSLLGIPGLMIPSLLARHLEIRSYEKAKVANKRKYREKYNQGNEMKEQMKSLGKSYTKALAELKDLEPQKDVVMTPLQEYQKSIENTISADGTGDIVCKKCGGVLLHDLGKKLYICRSCGIAYGPLFFRGEPIRRASEELKSGDFKAADLGFANILESDPDNFEALRGRVLCAGGWRSFSEIKLNDRLAQVDWPAVEERVNQARTNCDSKFRNYMVEMGLLVNAARQYYINVIVNKVVPVHEVYDPKVAAYEKMKKERESSFHKMFYNFIEEDRKHMLDSAEERKKSE
jgi:tetratricopeptide (TPR) repeat protein